MVKIDCSAKNENILNTKIIGKIYCFLNFLYQPGLPILEVGIKSDVSIKG